MQTERESVEEYCVGQSLKYADTAGSVILVLNIVAHCHGSGA